MNEKESLIFDDDVRAYEREVMAIESLSEEDEKYYFHIAKNCKVKNNDENGSLRDDFAREIIIKAHLKLVLTIIRKNIFSSKIPVSDLIQEGNLGLMAAFDKFNPDLGYRFSTYASWWIRQAMFKAISEQSYCMKIPVYVQETLSKYKKVKQNLEKKSGCEVDNASVANEMGIKRDKIDEYLNAFSKSVSLDSRIEKEDKTSHSLYEIIQDVNADCEAVAQYEDLKNDVYRALNFLKEKEREVLKMRYGLNDDEPLTLLEIGNIFGVTKECIRQIEKRAIQKISSDENATTLLKCYV